MEGMTTTLTSSSSLAQALTIEKAGDDQSIAQIELSSKPFALEPVRPVADKAQRELPALCFQNGRRFEQDWQPLFSGDAANEGEDDRP